MIRKLLRRYRQARREIRRLEKDNHELELRCQVLESWLVSRAGFPTDDELAGKLGSTLHTQWRRQGDPDASPCMCDHCRQVRRELWFSSQGGR